MHQLEATWLGTASVLLKTAETTLLFDPFIELPGGEHPNSAADFLSAEHVLITHAHLDHLASIPALLRAASPAVYCTGQAAKLLRGAPSRRESIHKIAPGDRLALGGAEVTVYPGQHIEFDSELVRRTLSPANLRGRFWQALGIYFKNLYYREKGETVFYDLRCCGLHLQLMGSLALRGGVDYPTGADVLFLPYQGSSDLPGAAGPVLERLRPKKIIATHFDDAFPPISHSIDAGSLVELVSRDFPETEVLIPRFGEPIVLA